MGKENPQPRIAHDGLLRANWQTAKRLIVPTFAGTLAIIGAACSSGTEKGISASEHAPLDLSSSNPAETKKAIATPTPPISAPKIGESQVSVQQFTEIPPGFLRSKSLIEPFQIDRPAAWGQMQQKESDGTLTVFIEIFPDFSQFSVTVIHSNKWITADDFKDERINYLTNEENVKKIQTTPNQNIAGQKAWKIESSEMIDVGPTPEELKRVDYIFSHNGQIWVVQYQAKAPVFTNKSPIFQTMISSFKLLQ